MSFAGHVFDMIRRNKEDREMLNRLRGRNNDSRTAYTSHIPDISAEEFDRINHQIKERERTEQRYLFRTRLIFLVVTTIVMFVLFLLFATNIY